MKTLLIAVGIAGFWLGAGVSPGQSSCQVTVRASVEVAGEFSLADLLGRGTCSKMLGAAAQVRMGSAPVAGSVRVLEGREVRAAVQKVVQKLKGNLGREAGEFAPLLVPERITVRRAGARASCADIARSIPGTSPGTADCGAADRIARDAALEFSRPAWDPALGRWQLYARCVHPADCVPFLVRLRGRDAGAGAGAGEGAEAEAETATEAGKARSPMARLAAMSSQSVGQAASGRGRAVALVRPGQAVTLLWDQDGIRLVIPAVALDPGAPGERVRARIVRGGRLVRAVVVSAGMVRAVS